MQHLPSLAETLPSHADQQKMGPDEYFFRDRSPPNTLLMTFSPSEVAAPVACWTYSEESAISCVGHLTPPGCQSLDACSRRRCCDCGPGSTQL